MNYWIVHLCTGTRLFGIEKTKYSDDSLLLEDPQYIVETPEGRTMVPYLQMTDEKQVRINFHSIISYYRPDQETINFYKEIDSVDLSNETIN